MNRSSLLISSLLILNGAAIAIMSGYSSAAPPEIIGSQAQPVAATKERVVSQTGPLAPGTGPLGVLTVSDAGTPTANTALLAAGDPNEMATLRGIALGVSSGAGVSSPATIQAVVASDRQTAASILSGATIQDHTPVYVVKVKGGRFTSPRHPPGVAAPQHAFLTVTVDAATKRVTDIGYVDAEPDLTQIGSPVVDLAAP
jgi:hypothetical protein